MDSILPPPPHPISLADLVARSTSLSVSEAVALALSATEEHDDPWATTLHAIPALDGLLLRDDGAVVVAEPAAAVAATIAGQQLAELVRTLLRPVTAATAGFTELSAAADAPAATVPADLEALLLRASADASGSAFDYPAFRLDLTRFGTPTPALLSAIYRRSAGEWPAGAAPAFEPIGRAAAGGGRAAKLVAVAVASWLAGVAVGAGAAVLLDRAGMLQAILTR